MGPFTHRRADLWEYQRSEVSAGMSFELTEDQQLIRKSVAELASKFDDQYWMKKDLAHEFPQEFYDAIAKGGWLGMTIPEEYGGHGLGITEATLLLEEVARSGGAMNAASAIHLSIFGMQPVVVHGSDELKAAHAAPHRRRRPARLFRCHRARCGPGHVAHHHVRQARRRPLRRQRPKGVDLQGVGVGEDPAAHPHYAI